VIVNVNIQLTRARPQWRVLRKQAVALLQPNTSSMPTSSMHLRTRPLTA
jgi:hypothetical protein